MLDDDPDDGEDEDNDDDPDDGKDEDNENDPDDDEDENNDDDPDDGKDEDNDRGEGAAGAVAVVGGRAVLAGQAAVGRRETARSSLLPVELSPSSVAQSGLRPRSRQTSGHTTCAPLPKIYLLVQPKTTPLASCAFECKARVEVGG